MFSDMSTTDNNENKEATCKESDTYKYKEEKYVKKFMRNFREMLWYWQEFYERRGRDRLTLELSFRISFKYWMDLVGKNYFEYYY